MGVAGGEEAGEIANARASGVAAAVAASAPPIRGGGTCPVRGDGLRGRSTCLRLFEQQFDAAKIAKVTLETAPASGFVNAGDRAGGDICSGCC